MTSPAEAIGLPRAARMVQSAIPSTGVTEGAFFLSDGSGGLIQGDPYFRPASNAAPINILMGIAGPEDLATTLLAGNTTDGSDIVMSDGDAIRSEDSGAGVAGRPVILAPGTTVDTDVGPLLWGDSYASTLRGKAAIDLQFGRSSAAKVVQPGNDYAAIVGGRNHQISGNAGDHTGIFAGEGNTISGNSIVPTYGCVILGGKDNTISGTGTHIEDGAPFCSAIVAGHNNTITAPSVGMAFTLAGAFIGGGRNNTIEGTAYGSAIVGGGYCTIDSGTAYASNGYCFVSGKNNTISTTTGTGCYHSAAFGENNTITAAQDVVVFGRNNTVTGDLNLVGGEYCVVPGYECLVWGKNITTHSRVVIGAAFGEGTRLYSSNQFAVGGGGLLGVSQGCIYSREITTTNATPTNLSVSQRLYIPPERSFGFRIIAQARQTGGVAGTVGDSAMWVILGCIKRDNASNTALVGSVSGAGVPSLGFNDAAAAAWSIAVTADDALELLALTVTGEASKNITWTFSIFDAEAG